MFFIDLLFAFLLTTSTVASTASTPVKPPPPPPHPPCRCQDMPFKAW